MKNQTITQELLMLPELIKQTQQEFVSKREDLAKFESSMVRIKASVKYDVSSAVGEDDKPIYKNEDMRSAEVRKRLAKDEGYRQIAQDIDKLRREISTLEIEIEYLKRKNNNYRCIAELIAHEGEKE